MVRCPHREADPTRQPSQHQGVRKGDQRLLGRLAKAVPEDLDIHLVLDNYGTHKTAMIHDWLAGHNEDSIDEYLTVHNENPKPFIWTKSADQILESLKTYCERSSETGH